LRLHILGDVSKPPRSPYPPDVDGDPPRADGLSDVVDAVAIDQDWANERARGWSALRVELRRCRLTGAELAEATLKDVVFEECRVDLAGLRHASLERVVFRDCRMGECDFYGSGLKDVLFERCELREATFSTCTLERVELRGCDLAAVRGVEAMRGARMTWNDVIENAALFASAAGIEVVD
jgi:uncharacterized protein YjbI with pentapeptide repeats